MIFKVVDLRLSDDVCFKYYVFFLYKCFDEPQYLKLLFYNSVRIHNHKIYLCQFV